ncbi:MAG: hypothetical protein AAGB93_15635, partial [Planctomycetota bacterium]
ERVERALDRPAQRGGRGLAPLALGRGVAVAAAAPRGTGGAPPREQAAAALARVGVSLDAIDRDLRQLADHPDSGVRDRAAALLDRREELERAARRLALTLPRPVRASLPREDPNR